jgi:hypothetical protein
MDHSVGGRATIWRELRVKFGSDFGDVQPHMIGGGSLGQEVGHLSQQIGSASKIPVNLGTFFSNQVSNVCISAKICRRRVV